MTAPTAQPNCPLCRGTQATFIFQERAYRLLQCHQCQMFFIDPYPAQATETFDRVAEYAYDDLEIIDVDRHYRSSTLYYDMYYPRLEPELRDARRILDVGCGTGRLLELLAQRPELEREGIELNRRRAEFARTRTGCSIWEVPLEAFQPSEPYDVILLMNVLSHVSHLDPFFGAVRRLLRGRGKVILKVGEMSSKIRRHAVHDWGIPDHLHFLGMETMHHLARRYGFRITRHDRQPLSAELFDVRTWKTVGRSRWRNALKHTVASFPWLLPVMAKIYDQWHGATILTSLVVLEKEPNEEDA